MTDEEKKAQVEAVAGAPVDEVDVLYPDPVKFKLKDREYSIKPLPLNGIKKIVRLQKLKLESEEDVDEIINLVSDILPEPDKQFIGDNINFYNFVQFCTLVNEVSFKGVPKSNSKKNIS